MSRLEDIVDTVRRAMSADKGIDWNKALELTNELLDAHKLSMRPQTHETDGNVVVESGKSWEVRVNFPPGTLFGNRYSNDRVIYVFAGDAANAIQVVAKEYPRAVVLAVNHGRNDAMVIAPVELVKP